MSTDELQERYKNSVMLSIMSKPQQQKNEKQQIIMKTVNAEWHTIINRLNELADGLLKFKEAGQQQNQMSDVTQWVRVLWMQANQSKNSVQKQLLRIEKKLNNLTEKDDSMNQTQLNIQEEQSSVNI